MLNKVYEAKFSEFKIQTIPVQIFLTDMILNQKDRQCPFFISNTLENKEN